MFPCLKFCFIPGLWGMQNTYSKLQLHEMRGIQEIKPLIVGIWRRRRLQPCRYGYGSRWGKKCMAESCDCFIQTHFPPITFDSFPFARNLIVHPHVKFESERGWVNTEGRDVTSPFRLAVTHTLSTPVSTAIEGKSTAVCQKRQRAVNWSVVERFSHIAHFWPRF